VSPADSVVPPVRIRRGGKAFSCFPSLFLRFQVLKVLLDYSHPPIMERIRALRNF